jgi:uncharacterized membrane protein YdbT with pleckstrin-like domain
MDENTDAPSWVTLTSDEQLVWNGHPSVWSSGRWIVAGLILIGVGIGGFVFLSELLQRLSLIPIVVGFLIIVVPILLKRLKTQYVITSEEVYKKEGLFSRDVTNLRLDRIQNTSYTQSFLERLLTYGTIDIEMAGDAESDLVFHDVPDPEHVIGLITERLDAVSPQSRTNQA